jgi:NADH-quinone oxidoreductase subunit J
MFTSLQILFIIVAAITFSCALMVVTARNLVHSALWLVASLFGVAIVFAILQAGFLAVVQVVIYIGAIAVLMIFAIMLTRRIAQETTPRFNENWIWAVLVALVLFAGLVWMLVEQPAVHTALVPLDARVDPLKLLGAALVSPNGYVLPFELASVLLLAALIGAIVVAWEKK